MKKRKNDNQRRSITRNKESAVAYSSLRNNSWFFFLKLRKRSLLSCINCGVMRTFTLRAWVTCEISRNLSNSHVHGTWSRPNNPIKRRYLNRIMLWLLNSCSLLSSVILNSHLKTAVQSVSVITGPKFPLFVARFQKWWRRSLQAGYSGDRPMHDCFWKNNWKHECKGVSSLASLKLYPLLFEVPKQKRSCHIEALTTLVVISLSRLNRTYVHRW